MTDIFKFANNATTTITTALAPSDTEIVVADGSVFPTLEAGYVFMATLVNATSLIREIVKVTDIDGETLTVERAQEGTTALTWIANSVIQQLATQGQMESFVQTGQIGLVGTPEIVDGVLELDLNFGRTNAFEVEKNANVSSIVFLNAQEGKAVNFTLDIIADGSAYTWVFPGQFLPPTIGDPTLSTTAGQRDRLVGMSLDGAAFQWFVFAQGFTVS
jgi:hypothetical protein